MTVPKLRRLPSVFRRFLDSEASGGLVLIAAAVVALALANSPLAPRFQALLTADLAGHAVEAWINDGLMAVFFLLVGLEIKREILHGQLRTWPDRVLPGLGAVGGMAVPALIFAASTWQHPHGLRGWAVPSATDIAFALGVLSLLGDRVPASLKVFLAALAVLDDLGAILIIAIFYAGPVSLPMLSAACVVLASLIALNRFGVHRLWPFLCGGVMLWGFVWASGLHATIAGVLLAFTIPDDASSPPRERERATPLDRLETSLSGPVAFLILPLFALANAGVAVGSSVSLLKPVTLGVACGLVLGKQAGVLSSLWLAVRLGWARRPAGASWPQLYGVALLCGIGFTMSLFIGLLAYADRPDLLADTKVGVLLGSVLSALIGTAVLRFAPDGRRSHLA